MKKTLILLLIALFGYNCATVPVTGRKQLSLISNSELLPMSYDNYKTVLDSTNLSTNKLQSEMVKRVGV
ncbi:MAG: M48 family peptidase, partial [Cyclobacteriaceae bacterium]|nr:M48 family peptidase [Cyclobacteriaceae bacterium]